MKFLGLIWSNLKRKKLRTILTLLSIFTAFLLFGFLCAIRDAFTVGVKMADADRLIVRHKVSLIQTLPVSYGPRIGQIPGVAAYTHMTWFGGIYQDPKNFFGNFPVEIETFFDLYPEFTLPADQLERWKKTRNGCIIGRALANNPKFNWKVGDKIPLTSPIWGEPANATQWDFEVCGIFDSTKKGGDTSGMYFRYDFFDEARPRGKGEVGWYIVRTTDAKQADTVAAKIDEPFANSPFETKAEPEGAFAAGFAQQIGDIGKILIAVLSAVFFTILLVAGNTMSQSVRERTEEIGVLKALGFPGSLILILVLAESCVIALLGGLTGLFIAWGLLAAGNPVPQLLPILEVPQVALQLGTALALGLGLATGILPAFYALRLRTAAALRRNG
jgi:putative ABC transport system permease protein